MRLKVKYKNLFNEHRKKQYNLNCNKAFLLLGGGYVQNGMDYMVSSLQKSACSEAPSKGTFTIAPRVSLSTKDKNPLAKVLGGLIVA